MSLSRSFVRPLVPRSRWSAIALGLVLFILVSWCDWETGPNVDFSLFYLIPISYLAWYGGKWFGFAAAILATLLWWRMDALWGVAPVPFQVASRLGTRLVFFSSTVLLFQIWKNIGRRLTQMVDERTEALRRLAAQLSAAEDAERRKLAHAMHDALGQTLTLIKINLDQARSPHPEDREATQRRLADCVAMLDTVIRQTRTLTFDLYPAMLDDLGLIPTLEWYAREFGDRCGVEVIVSQHGSPRALPSAAANYLFRAVKELLGNAVRHGGAREIVVATHWESGRLRLVIDDDGLGFDVAAARAPDPHRGLGLLGIEERVNSMGGQFELESSLGQGCRAIIEIPLADAVTQSVDVLKDKHHVALASTAG